MTEIQLESLFEVVAVQSGARFKVDQHKSTAMASVAENVTSGGTMLLQTSPDGAAWTTRKTRVIAANGVFTDRYYRPDEGTVVWARARLTVRTDGTFSAYIIRRGY